MSKKLLSREELIGQLNEHIGFIHNSCALFDVGCGSEAKRVATSIRVLVHDSAMSHSLLGQLGCKESLDFLSSATPNRVKNIGPYWGLLNISLPKPIYVPKLNKDTARPMRFSDWWQEKILKDGDQTLYSRRDLVFFLANKDGGAHVDPEMDDAYQRLTRENHIGIEVAVAGKQIKWNENPVLPSVRQIGHEILETLKALQKGAG